MTVESPAIEWVRIVAERLGELREEVVFLGGATVGLLVTDPAAAAVRPTKDVDVIVEVGSWGEYVPLQERLRDRGFAEDTEEGAPLCRFEGIKVDVMPTSEEILGFSNRWYGPAMAAAQRVQLTDAITIRLVTAPYFLATKLEAFRGRGQGDYRLSHDLEDLIALLDGRPASGAFRWCWAGSNRSPGEPRRLTSDLQALAALHQLHPAPARRRLREVAGVWGRRRPGSGAG